MTETNRTGFGGSGQVELYSLKSRSLSFEYFTSSGMLAQLFLASKIGGLIAAPVDPASMSHSLQELIWSGAYVGTIVPPPATSLLNAPQYETGKVLAEAAAKYINEKLGGKANAVILSHDSMEFLAPRFAAMRDVFKTMPGVTVVADISPTPVNKEGGFATMSTILQVHPDADVVLGADTVVLGALAALEAAGKAKPEQFLGGIDGEPEAVAAISFRGRRSKTSATNFTVADGGQATSVGPARDLSPSAETTSAPPVAFSIAGARKSYGALTALEEAGFTVGKGEIVCLLGDNGAGKSTLVKIISGAIHPDAGSMTLEGSPITFKSPQDARAAGLETVYQDLALCPNLSVAHNMILGREETRRWLGILPVRDDRKAAEQCRGRLGALGVRLRDEDVLVRSLSGGRRQSIAIARSLTEHVKLICLDEPTAALGVRQTAQVVNLIRSIAAGGTGVILVTHDLATVRALADRIVVLSLGRVAYDGSAKHLTADQLWGLMASGALAPAAQAPALPASLCAAQLPPAVDVNRFQRERPSD